MSQRVAIRASFHEDISLCISEYRRRTASSKIPDISDHIDCAGCATTLIFYLPSLLAEWGLFGRSWPTWRVAPSGCKIAHSCCSRGIFCLIVGRRIVSVYSCCFVTRGPSMRSNQHTQAFRDSSYSTTAVFRHLWYCSLLVKCRFDVFSGSNGCLCMLQMTTDLRNCQCFTRYETLCFHVGGV